MQDNNETSSSFVKEVEGKIDSVVLNRTTIHWYRYDPNRPTLDQLRAAERDREKRSFQEKKSRLSEDLKRSIGRLKFW